METSEIYKKIERLIIKLRESGNIKDASILDHRLHKVAWTTSSELFEEISNVLEKIDLGKVDTESTIFLKEIKNSIDEMRK